jgi:GDP-L-fucose synthase
MNTSPKKLRVFIAGHTGMVGRALHRALDASPDMTAIIHPERLDYTQQTVPHELLERYQPDAVVLCAAKVGGIHANNTQRADFIEQNLSIQLNWIQAAHQHQLKKFILLGSSCIYPRDTQQPIPESALLTGSCEPTNQPYAIAKIAGIELCNAFHHQYQDNFFAIMPPNQYGPFDNFTVGESHVVAALLRKVYEAADGDTITVWGSGTPLREFMHVDDLAAAIHFCLDKVNAKDCQPHGFFNAGTGDECSIHDLATAIIAVSGKNLSIKFDPTMPDGMPRKLMDSSLLHAQGWQSSIDLHTGLNCTWKWMKTVF